MPKASTTPKTSYKRNPGKHTRTPVSRMMAIYEAIRSGDYPTGNILAKKLEVSYRTILRDLEFMADSLKMPIEYDPVKRGYFCTADDTQFPLMKITEGELLALTVAERAMEVYRGTPFEAQLAQAFQKVTKALSDEITLDFPLLRAAISFRSPTVEVYMDLTAFREVSAALLAREEIEFEYTKLLEKGKPETRIVQPLHLTCTQGAWYLIAQDLRRKAARVFALTRIKNVVRTGRNFVPPENFHPDQKLAHSIGVFGGDNPETVVLRFTGMAAGLIRERRWHATQVLQELKDGRAELKLVVAITPELESWIFGWAPDVEVVQPDSLRESLHAKALQLADRLNRRGT